MSFHAEVFKVMIASPGDVVKERGIIRDALAKWNAVNSESRGIVLLPVGWETHSTPEMGDHPQKILNKQILKECDLLVGVFWTRIGTSTDDYPSGTVEEIEEHYKTGKPLMIYFSSAQVKPDEIDSKQYDELKKFKDSLNKRSLYKTYSDISEFKSLFDQDLSIKLNKDPYSTFAVHKYHFSSQPCWETIHKMREELFDFFFRKDENLLYSRLQELKKESQCFHQGDILNLIIN